MNNKLLILLGLLLAACTPTVTIPDTLPTRTPISTMPPVVVNDAPQGVWQPHPGTSWQLQFSGTIDTSFDVTMYDIDLFDTPQAVIDKLHADGRIVICYFSAGSWENWRADAGDFPPEVLGNTLSGWPDENWLDIHRIDLLAPVMTARLDTAVTKQCDGVDPDNVDGYDNDTGFPLTSADQIAYNTWLVAQAHARGLSIGLKNSLALIPNLVNLFDWALNEQCFEFAECDVYGPFIQANKAVFGVEYQSDSNDFCPQANAMNLDFLRKNLELDAWRTACR